MLGKKNGAIPKRNPKHLQAVLQEDAQSWPYRYLWLPLLIVQSLLYTRIVFRFLVQPVYATRASEAYPLLRENHIGNLVSVVESPDQAQLGVHVAMAWVWIAFTMLQKALVRRMGDAIASGNHRGFARLRRIHICAGWTLIALGFTGIAAAVAITWSVHGNPPMRQFLLMQPLFFMPFMFMVGYTARDRTRSIRDHRFWAETAFLGPAVASVWTEASIYVTAHYTPLGPHGGEYWSSVIGGTLGALVVMVPSWISRKRGLARDAMLAAPAS